jgi:autotransporter translocation and assembly factor TamB
VALSGTIGKPQLGGNLALALKRFPLPNSPLREITDSSIAVRFEGREIILDPSPINAAGGRLTLSGTASLAGEEPAFDVRAKGDHLLVWRNDAFVMRANCDVGLAGSPSKASLTGSVDLVDSLFYKDIEIIPIGVPTTAAPAPKLPKIDTEKRDPLASIPEPYRNWAMDLKLRTADPVLIRGNRARGQVTINAAVGGLVGAPRPSGTLQLRDVEASLPFSRMEIKRGVITLRPEHPFDPSLEVRGFSNVNRTQVSLFLYGPLSNPRFNLVSTPPLPPNEIMTLLATGATTTDLEDTSSASMRAFQLMLDELQHRASAAGNESFSQLLQALSGVQLQVGENDPFSGRSFNSATLQLTDKYYLNAGFDREGNTRSTVIYALGTR